MPNLRLSVNVRRPIAGGQWLQKEGLQHVLKFLQGCFAGTVECERVKWGFEDTAAIGALAYASPAAAALTFATSSGAVGAVIGGTTKTVTWATSDTASATAFAAAVRTDAALNRIVTATNLLAKMTCASVLAGDAVTVWGKRFTAIANGATPRNDGEFSIGASDSACAANLAAAIVRHPALAGVCVAVSVSGVVYVGHADNRTAQSFEALRAPSSSTIAVNTASPTAGAVTLIVCAVPGQVGNAIAATASGTNVTIATNGTTGYLGGGTGGSAPTASFEVSP